MPILVPNGPDLPDALLHALEDDRLVLLCGAGISTATGLPSFRGLVEEAFRTRNVPLEGPAQECLDRGELDRALDLLEQMEGRDARLMRQFVCERLVQPPQGADEDLALHRAILDLARRPKARDGSSRGWRLVTTNFDNRFALAGLRPEEMEDAPRLAPPRFDRLCRVVFLHGRIRKGDPSSAEELVLTSRDFGNAYLRDGWAARFVLELLREFHVLLVGYSLSDPVMRYLVEAIAAESGPDGQFRKVWALAPFDHGKPDDPSRQQATWKARNVEPILYKAPGTDHGLLRATMVEWARRYSGGLEGRPRVALERMRAPLDPVSDQQTLQNVLWALGEESGRTARIVVDAALDGPKTSSERPHVSWLCPLIAAEIHDPRKSRDPKARCKLLELPAVEDALRRWFMGSRGDLDLVRHVVERDPPVPAAWVERMLMGDHHAVDDSPAGQFWCAYAAVQPSDLTAFTELQRLLDPEAPLHMRSHHGILGALAPRLLGPKPPLPLGPQPQAYSQPTRLRQLAEFNVGFRDERLRHEIIKRIQRDDRLEHTAINFLDDLTSVLAEHCRLSVLADQPPGKKESWPGFESFDRDELERWHDDWHALASLLARGFRAACDQEPTIADAILDRWHLLWRVHEYGIFARLWLRGAATYERADVRAVVAWLRKETGRLWNQEWDRELRLWLIRRGADLAPADLEWLVDSILKGPGTDVTERYPEDRRDEIAGKLANDVLEALSRSHAAIPAEYRARARSAVQAVEQRNEELRREHPNWPFDEVGALSHFSSSGWAADLANVDRLTPDEIALAIRDFRNPWGSDDGVGNVLAKAVRRSGDAPSAIADALLRLDERRAEVWSSFWRALTDPQPDPARDMEALIERARRSPAMLAEQALVGYAEWLLVLAPKPGGQQGLFLQAWDEAWKRAASGPHVGLSGGPSVTTAINSGAGKLAEALVARLGEVRGEDDSGLPEWYRARAERIVGGTTLAHVHGIAVLSWSVRFLFAVDPEWTREHLLPHLDPDRSPETAGAAWGGYLHRPGYDAALVAALAPKLIAMTHRRDTIPKDGVRDFPSLLILAAMDHPEAFPKDDLLEALITLGPDELAKGLHAVRRRLEAVGDKAAELWRSYVGPWIEQNWPGLESFRQGKACLAANALLLHTREAFPKALALLRQKKLVQSKAINTDSGKFLCILSNLQPITESTTASDQLRYNYSKEFPQEIVSWLNEIFDPSLIEPHASQRAKERVRAAIEHIPESTPGLQELREKLR